MTEHTTITLPKTMPLVDRISVVSREISEWLDSLDSPFNAGRDVMHLMKYTSNGKYVYHYVIDRSAR